MPELAAAPDDPPEAYAEEGVGGGGRGGSLAEDSYDRATNLWPLTLFSFGESWHNIHHSDAACTRRGTGPRQIDISAAVIRVFERLGGPPPCGGPTPPAGDHGGLPCGSRQRLP
jgi:hypothetical protein